MGVSRLKAIDVNNMLESLSGKTAIINLGGVVREVSVLCYNYSIVFQTDKRSKKMQNAMGGPNSMSLKVGNLYIDNVPIHNMGHPLDEINSNWLAKFKQVHPNTVNKYSSIDTEVMIRVNILEAEELRMWEYDSEHNPYIHSIKNPGLYWKDILYHGDTLEEVKE